MPVRSAPAQKALSPAPVRTTTRTAASDLADATNSRMAVITPQDSEFRRSGRLMVMRPTPASTEYSTSLLGPTTMGR